MGKMLSVQPRPASAKKAPRGERTLPLRLPFHRSAPAPFVIGSGGQSRKDVEGLRLSDALKAAPKQKTEKANVLDKPSPCAAHGRGKLPARCCRFRLSVPHWPTNTLAAR